MLQSTGQDQVSCLDFILEAGFVFAQGRTGGEIHGLEANGGYRDAAFTEGGADHLESASVRSWFRQSSERI
jgi:hypothetical protein